MRLATASAAIILCLSICATGAIGATALNPQQFARITAIWPKDQSERGAAVTLRKGLLNQLGRDIKIQDGPDKHGETILLGTPKAGGLINRMVGALKQAANGYLIGHATQQGNEYIVIAGINDASVSKGVAAFLMMIQKGERIAELQTASPQSPMNSAVPTSVPVSPAQEPATAPKKPLHTSKPPQTAAPSPQMPPQPAFKIDLLSAGLALSLLISLSALILALVVLRRNRMSGSALRGDDYESTSNRLSRLEKLVEQMLARQPASPSPASADPARPAARVHDRSQQFRDDESTANQFQFDRNPVRRPPIAELHPAAEPRLRPSISDAAAAQETRSLVSEYHKLIATRMNGLQAFIDRYGAQPIQPTSEAGQYRAGSDDEDCYLWAVRIVDRDDYIVILPGKEMIKKWSLFSKAAGSGAKPYLNGAYNLSTGSRGELSIIEPAIAEFDARKKLFVLQNPGTLSGAT